MPPRRVDHPEPDTPSAGADLALLEDRRKQIVTAGGGDTVACSRKSTAGAVSQRACVFCGSRVVLYPVTDALHLIHGPIGCAAYTWDIRGALSSTRELHRLSFSTDMRETDVIYGGERKLGASLRELIARHRPAAAFVYSTCIVGIIGDDVEAVCRGVAEETGIPVIPVNAPGFAGTKKDGYKAACDALGRLVGTGEITGIAPQSINILGEFNLAGETWMLKRYYERMGIEVVATITGDARIADVRRAHGAALNVVQCSGSMIHLAKAMEQRYGIPCIRVSYFGIEDTATALYDVAHHFADPAILDRTRSLVGDEVGAIQGRLRELRRALQGRTAAIYTGGAFKAISLVRALRSLGMRTVLAGSQTGNDEDYAQLAAICDPETVIVDDINTLELARFLERTPTDLFIGGVKERPIAYKLGVAFCDHNHERKHALAGFTGMVNFAEEVHRSVTSPVWRFRRRNTAVAHEEPRA
ncbi:MAG: nitrogenase iron-molybdenum cofactor biosynthesis protein NifE [Planctomycetota bacterium]